MTITVGAQQVTTTAPVRLDFAGGWTDVPPFSSREGGAVVSATIDLAVRATASWGDRWRLVAGELGADIVLEGVESDPGDRRVALHRATLRALHPPRPVTLATASDVPPGSGLGSSGALGVALVHALGTLMGRVVDATAAAALAFEVETVGARVPGGKQDQYSAAHGGFNLMRFHDPDVLHEPLILEPAFLEALQASLVLCYSGASRLSGNTIARVMAAYDGGAPVVAGALRMLRDLALEMREALAASDLARTATLLSANWVAQQQLDPAMCTPGMADLEAAMAAAGALGGKAAGSGAGGCMFFVVPDVGRAQAVARDLGCKVLPVRFTATGVQGA